MDSWPQEQPPRPFEAPNSPDMLKLLDDMDMYFAIQGEPSTEVRERESEQYALLTESTNDINLLIPSILFSNERQWKEDPGYYRAVARVVRDKWSEPS